MIHKLNNEDWLKLLVNLLRSTDMTNMIWLGCLKLYLESMISNGKICLVYLITLHMDIRVSFTRKCVTQLTVFILFHYVLLISGMVCQPSLYEQNLWIFLKASGMRKIQWNERNFILPYIIYVEHSSNK